MILLKMMMTHYSAELLFSDEAREKLVALDLDFFQGTKIKFYKYPLLVERRRNG